MKRKVVDILILSILCISLLPIAGYFENSQVQTPDAAYTPITNIYINGNEALATFCDGNGTGTAEDPFIIEKYIMSEMTGKITILNTDAYLCIRNNTMNEISNGIKIENAKNINISINNISTNACYRGIQILNSQNISISANTITGPYIGIDVREAENVNISTNILTNNPKGIYILSSHNLSISENTINYSNTEGIELQESQNMTISTNNIVNCGRCIFAVNLENITISGNTITDSEEGMDISASNYLNIQSNIIQNLSNFGINFDQSNFNRISGNTVEDCANRGISIGYLKNNTFTDNTFARYGFYLQYPVENTTIDTSNKVNGKSVRYFQEQNNISMINETDIGQLLLVGVNNSEFRGLNISHTGIGIMVKDSYYNTFADINSSCNNESGIYLSNSSYNSFSDIISNYNNGSGIYLLYSSNNSITMSEFEFNLDGLLFLNSTYNKIAGNSIKNNTNRGINIGSSSQYNRLYYNAFIDNTAHVQGTAYGNFWDDGKKGNYWSNYTTKYPDASNDGKIWDTPYIDTCYSEILVQDLFPLAIIPFSITEAPPVLTTSTNESPTGNISLQWDSILEAEYYLVYRSDAIISDSDLEGLTPIANTTTTEYSESLPNGTYYYAVVAVNEFDSSKNLFSNNVNVKVAIPPPTQPEDPEKPGEPGEPGKPDQPEKPEEEEPSTIDGFPLAIFGVICVISLIVKRRRIAVV